jgi:hypothetical protein
MRELERACGRERAKGELAHGELRRVRAELAQRDRELNAALVRAKVAPGSSIRGASRASSPFAQVGGGSSSAVSQNGAGAATRPRRKARPAPIMTSQSAVTRASSAARASAASASSEAGASAGAPSPSGMSGTSGTSAAARAQSKQQAQLARAAELAALEREARSAAEEREALEAELARLRETVACQEADLHAAASEIEVLAGALETRAEELGVDGNLASGALYQLSLMRHEAAASRGELSRQRQVWVDERQALELELLAAQRKAAELLDERQVVLDFIQETNRECERLRAFVARLERERDEAVEEFRAALASASARSGVRVRVLDGACDGDSGSGSDGERDGERDSERDGERDGDGDRERERGRGTRMAAKLRDRAPALRPLEEGPGELEHSRNPGYNAIVREAEWEAAQGRLEQQLRAAESRARALQGQLDEERAESARSRAEAHELRGGAATAAGSPNSGTRGSLLERVERLEAQLKAALEARALAENEATLLEAANARLRRDAARAS